MTDQILELQITVSIWADCLWGFLDIHVVVILVVES